MEQREPAQAALDRCWRRLERPGTRRARPSSAGTGHWPIWTMTGPRRPRRAGRSWPSCRPTWSRSTRRSVSPPAWARRCCGPVGARVPDGALRIGAVRVQLGRPGRGGALRGVPAHPRPYRRVRAVDAWPAAAEGHRRGRRRSPGQPGPAGYGAVVWEAATGEVLVEPGRGDRARPTTWPSTPASSPAFGGGRAGRGRRRGPDGLQARRRADVRRWQIKHPGLRPLAAAGRRLGRRVEVRFTWIPRERNTARTRWPTRPMDGRPPRSWTRRRLLRAVRRHRRRCRPGCCCCATGRPRMTEQRRYCGRGDVPPLDRGLAPGQGRGGRVTVPRRRWRRSSLRRCCAVWPRPNRSRPRGGGRACGASTTSSSATSASGRASRSPTCRGAGPRSCPGGWPPRMHGPAGREQSERLAVGEEAVVADRDRLRCGRDRAGAPAVVSVHDRQHDARGPERQAALAVLRPQSNVAVAGSPSKLVTGIWARRTGT